MVMPSMSANGSPSMSMRSENVPESPSSALQAMYFCAGRLVEHRLPLDAGRKRGAAASAQARSRSRRARCPAAAWRAPRQSRIAAVRDVVVEVRRIDDAEARAGEPLLAREPGMRSMSPRRSAMRARRRASPRRAARARRRRAPVHRRRGPRRSPLRPAARASTGRASRCARCAIGSRACWHSRASACGHGIRAQRQRAGIAGHEHRDRRRALMRARPIRSRSSSKRLRRRRGRAARRRSSSTARRRSCRGSTRLRA